MNTRQHMVALVAVLAVTAVFHVCRAEKIPLRSGRTVECEVLGYTAKGIRIKEKYGELVRPWSQVSARHPEHPLHEEYVRKKEERAKRKAEREARAQEGGKESRDTAQKKEEEEGEGEDDLEPDARRSTQTVSSANRGWHPISTAPPTDQPRGAHTGNASPPYHVVRTCSKVRQMV